ncbi:DUF6246 family protein [Comamonadaceae bacterium PP-2]
MLVECGFTRITTGDGQEFTFQPSLARIARLGSPAGIVQSYANLHGARCVQEARFVLAGLCDQDEVSLLVGELSEAGWQPGLMGDAEMVIIARHLMQHGIVGKAQPGKGDGSYSAEFKAHEYIAAARVHLGLSTQDAEALSMTEFQTLFEMKFPSKDKRRDLPSQESYKDFMAKIRKPKSGTATTAP